MSAELLAWLSESAIATSVAILAVLLLRSRVRRVFGACAGYALWLLVPAAWAATLLPAPIREVVVARVPQPLGSVGVATAAAPAFDAAVWLALVWALGAIAVAAVGWRRQRTFLRRLGTLTPRADGSLQSDAILGLPAVVGLRPRIVLPADFDTRYRADERELILAHERIHVRRGDLAVQALLFAFRSVYWFNPLAWFAAERVRRDQELACDAGVVARHPDARRVYGEAMVKISLGYTPAPLACHWAGTHPLKERIQMLKQTTPTARRLLAASLTLALLTAGGGYAAWAMQPPQTRIAAAPAQHPQPNKADTNTTGAWKRTPGVTLHFVKISLPDAARRVADAGKVHLVNPDALRGAGTVTFDFTDVDVITALKIVAQEAGKAVQVDGDQVSFVPQVQSRAKAAKKTAANRQEASVQLGMQRPPRYPESAVANKQSGIVIVIVDVTAEGRVAGARIEKSVPAGVFDATTLEAVKQWTFNPAVENGKPVAGRVRVPVQFDMDEDVQAPSGKAA